MHLINHTTAETLTAGRMIPPGTNSPSTVIVIQTYISSLVRSIILL
jgi:hypothetical protein